jgi:hypothetical protein
MSNTINFDEVNEITGVEPRERKMLSPSVQVLTVEEAEFKDNANAKRYLALKLVNEKGQYMKSQIYVTTNSGWARVKELAASTGNPLAGNLDESQIVAKILGKSAGFIIDGEITMADIDGNTVKVTRPTLRFTKFSFPVNELEANQGKFKITDKTVAVETLDSIPAVDVNDLPF